MQKLFPPQWETLGLAAPASLPDTDSLARAEVFLQKQGLNVVMGFDNRERDPLSYLSASPRCRLQHLNSLIRDPRVDAIYCIRGGFGSIHLLEEIDFDSMRKRNLPLIGYSDITALHMAMLRKKAGIPISACMALKLEEESKTDAVFTESFRRALALGAAGSRGIKPKSFRTAAGDLLPLNDAARSAGKVEGRLLCGNITVMSSLCGTEFFPSTAGRIVLLEDVGERTRRLDASFHQLRLNKVFARCKGVVLGNFQDCGNGKKEELEVMLKRFAALLECPVYNGLHFGHCSGSLAFVQEESIRLEGGKLFWKIPEKSFFSAERS